MTTELGRNEPCHCGSGKKFKRCHGVDAAPKLSAPAPKPENPTTQAMAGMDPSKMDPAMMQQMAKTLQRLPRNKLNQLQALMQRAMAGQDVSREAKEFEKLLPPEFAQLGQQMMMAQGLAGNAKPAEPLNEESAKKMIAEAVAEGKMSKDEAQKLLGEETDAVLSKYGKKGLGKFFSFGKK